MAREEVVSNASEQLILVDEFDREIGFKAKNDCQPDVGAPSLCAPMAPGVGGALGRSCDPAEDQDAR